MEFLHAPSSCKRLKLNCNLYFLPWLETFTDKVYLMAFLEKYCTKTFQACICLQSERFRRAIIFEYGDTSNFFFDGIKSLNMHKSPYKWYIFLVSSLKLSPSSAYLEGYLFM